jgi:hypothetical protein
MASCLHLHTLPRRDFSFDNKWAWCGSHGTAPSYFFSWLVLGFQLYGNYTRQFYLTIAIIYTYILIFAVPHLYSCGDHERDFESQQTSMLSIALTLPQQLTLGCNNVDPAHKILISVQNNNSERQVMISFRIIAGLVKNTRQC